MSWDTRKREWHTMKAGPGRPKGPPRRRVQVTLSEETWALVESVAERLGQSKAGLLAEVFDQAMPALNLTLEALELSKEAPREAQRLVSNYGAEKVMQLQQQQLELDRAVTKATKKQGGAKRGRAT